MLQVQNIKLNAKLTSTRRSVEMFLAGLSGHIDYPWTLDSMARHCDLGRSRFAHYCKQITNMTASEYLNSCRIEKARQLLTTKDPSSTILDIALKCGFDSSQYFATVFKKKTGMSPSQYQANTLAEQKPE
jgi:AraC family L-rhamnose operon regulatory protein RhaS